MNLARINEWFLAVLLSWLVMSHFVTVKPGPGNVICLIVALTVVVTIVTGIAAATQKWGE